MATTTLLALVGELRGLDLVAPRRVDAALLEPGTQAERRPTPARDACVALPDRQVVDVGDRLLVLGGAGEHRRQQIRAARSPSTAQFALPVQLPAVPWRPDRTRGPHRGEPVGPGGAWSPLHCHTSGQPGPPRGRGCDPGTQSLSGRRPQRL